MDYQILEGDQSTSLFSGEVFLSLLRYRDLITQILSKEAKKLSQNLLIFLEILLALTYQTEL